MAYREAWAFQKDWVGARKGELEVLAHHGPIGRPTSSSDESAIMPLSDTPPGRQTDLLVLVEHDPVITLGRRAVAAHILAPADELARRGVDLAEVERGGDVTYHGPGQLVAYPLLDLRHFRRDVRWYATSLLEVVVRTLAGFGITAELRRGDETGVWTNGSKIAALGLRIEQWFTYHGVALNVDMDLAAFDLIVPCGLAGASVTSMARELGRAVTLEEVKPAFRRAFGEVFGVEVGLPDYT